MSAPRGAAARYAAVGFNAQKPAGADSSTSSAAFMPSPAKPPLGPPSKVLRPLNLFVMTHLLPSTAWYRAQYASVPLCCMTYSTDSQVCDADDTAVCLCSLHFSCLAQILRAVMEHRQHQPSSCLVPLAQARSGCSIALCLHMGRLSLPGATMSIETCTQKMPHRLCSSSESIGDTGLIC